MPDSVNVNKFPTGKSQILIGLGKIVRSIFIFSFMATFIPSDGTLLSLTLENALVEAIMLLRSKELDTTLNPANENRVSYSIDQTNSLTGTATFNAVETVNTEDGSINWLVNNYLGSGFVFAKGTTGTLKSSNLPAAIIEIAKRIQLLEAQTAKNQSGLNRINITYDSDAATVQLTFESALTISISTDGKTQLTATVYLLD